MSRTVRPSATMRSASASGSATASRARAWPGGNLAAREQAARVFGQVGQAKRVGDMAPAFADDAGDVAVRIAMIGAELGVARGLFERVQIRPLHVLDNGDLERLAVASLDDKDRNLVQSRPLGGPPAALAGDDFIGVGDAGNGADDHRLDDPALLDRGGEFFELGIVESLSRIAGIGTQEFDRRLARAARGLGMRVRPAQQGRQASPQARAVFDGAAASSAMEPSSGFCRLKPRASAPRAE